MSTTSPKRRKAQKKHQPMINRQVSDENFPHTVKLCGACIAWAESIEVGQKLEWNDLNMVQIPLEVLLAFLKREAGNDGDVGLAAREAISLLLQFRSLARK